MDSRVQVGVSRCLKIRVTKDSATKDPVFLILRAQSAEGRDSTKVRVYSSCFGGKRVVGYNGSFFFLLKVNHTHFSELSWCTKLGGKGEFDLS